MKTTPSQSPIDSLDAFTRAYLTTALWSSCDEAYNQKVALKKEGYGVHSEIDAKTGKTLWTYTVDGDNGSNYIHEYEYECDAWRAAWEFDGGGSADTALEFHFDLSDIHPDSLVKAISDCARFQTEQGETLTKAIDTGEVKCGPDFDEMGRAGHDFWLSRNGHGAGFNDGDWPEPYGDQLQSAAKAFGEVNPWVDENDKVRLFE